MEPPAAQANPAATTKHAVAAPAQPKGAAAAVELGGCAAVSVGGAAAGSEEAGLLAATPGSITPDHGLGDIIDAGVGDAAGGSDNCPEGEPDAAVSTVDSQLLTAEQWLQRVAAKDEELLAKEQDLASVRQQLQQKEQDLTGVQQQLQQKDAHLTDLLRRIAGYEKQLGEVQQVSQQLQHICRQGQGTSAP